MRIRSVLSTLAVALMLVVGLDYVSYAATGQSLVLGKANKASTLTSLQRTTAGPALTIKVKPGSAPFTVSNGTKVARLNADLLDGLDSSQLRSRVTNIDPPGCPSLASVTGTFAKVGDLGTFTKTQAATYARVDAVSELSISTSGAGFVFFQLRIDNAPPANGSAVTVLDPVGPLVSSSLRGIFAGLPPGPHTVSVWARAAGGSESATDATFDAGCASLGNDVSVTEFR